MPLLVVDNGTMLRDALLHSLPEDTVVCSWDDVRYHTFDAYSGIILSGGSLFPVEGHEQDLADEIKQVRASTKPLLGICYGMEVMVKAFGGTLEHMNTDQHGTVKITVETPDPLFGDVRSFSLYEHHQWRAKQLPACLMPLASSAHGCEAVRHVDLPYYGLQFHPEHVAETDLGQQMIQRFVAMTK